jgi:hypothetical protein
LPKKRLFAKNIYFSPTTLKITRSVEPLNSGYVRTSSEIKVAQASTNLIIVREIDDSKWDTWSKI